jgi:pilus assembly protein CpaC
MNTVYRTRCSILPLVSVFILSFVLSFSQPVQAAFKSNRNSERNATKQDVLLIAGLQSTVDLTFDVCDNSEECVRVANKTLVQVQFAKEKKQLIFTPVKKGETTVVVRDQKGDLRLILNVVVSESNLTRRLIELRELLRDIEGLEMKIMADKIVIDGEVVVMNDLNRLYAVVSDPSYKDQVLNLVTVSPVGLQMMAERMQTEINEQNVKVRVLNGLFLIEGQVDSQGRAEQIINLATNMLQGYTIASYASEVRSPIEVRKLTVKSPIISRLTIAAKKKPPAEKMVRVTLDFVELSKDYLRNFGFSFSPSLDTGGSIAFGQSTTGGVTTAGSGSLSGTIANLFPKLSNAQNAGYARVLEQTVMIVKSGQKSVFDRTLDVPIQTTNATGQPNFNVVKLGPRVNLTPRVQGQTENIDMSIEFSYRGLAGKQGNAPISLNHAYNTTVVVKNGESAALVNALSNSISTAFNKDPPGGSLPANPLFTLLRSKAFQKSKSQFVVFVTPQILESTSTGTEDIKTKYGLKRK